jgi:hypothetical protein
MTTPLLPGKRVTVKTADRIFINIHPMITAPELLYLSSIKKDIKKLLINQIFSSIPIHNLNHQADPPF